MEKAKKSKATVKAPKHGKVDDMEINMLQRTVVLLDSRNDLVPMFFTGMEATSQVFESKAINPFVDFAYVTYRAFIETVREKSLKAMEKKNPQYGIADIVRNRKGVMRFIINLYIDEKDHQLYYTYVDPNDARAPRMVCTDKTMQSWIEK